MTTRDERGRRATVEALHDLLLGEVADALGIAVAEARSREERGEINIRLQALARHADGQPFLNLYAGPLDEDGEPVRAVGSPPAHAPTSTLTPEQVENAFAESALVVTTEAEITGLSAAWYALAGEGHVRDGDCHFVIEQVRETAWSYGGPPVKQAVRYVVSHHGALLGDFEAWCDTYPAALVTLRSFIQKSLTEKQALRDRLRRDDPAWEP